MVFKLSLIILIVLPVVFGLDGKQIVEYAVKQYRQLTKTIKIGTQYPSIGDPMSSTWNFTKAAGADAGFGNSNWTAGFYPGVLWYLYNYTKSDELKTLSIEATDGMYESQFITGTHDIGFSIMCSYGNGYEFTKNESYSKIIVNAANHLAMRYSPTIGCTRTWGNKGDPEFLVNVDNMMNLELLYRGYEITGNKTLYDIAVSHANRTIKEHLRKDYSSFHVVAFNESNGLVIRKFTHQGYNDSSCWSRGQAWLICGFTTAYRFTKSKHFLDAAENVSKYFIDHLPEDGIPYWDFNVPQEVYKYIPRDSSSASIAASGLFELYEHTKNEKYLNAAKKIMESLSSAKYRADGHIEYKLPALIVNGTTAGPNAAKGNSDLSIIYGDYYYIKALNYFFK